MNQNSILEFDVVVVGAGPGGYVSAIRASQLGLKTAIVEREYLGGVCLNVGCIPSKAMISASHFLEKAQHSSNEMGITFKEVSVDMKKLQTWKNSVSQKMSSGVKQLLKGNQVTIIMGEATFQSSTELVVKTTQQEGSPLQNDSSLKEKGNSPQQKNNSLNGKELDSSKAENKSREEIITMRSKNFIIATGSRPITIPGFPFDEKYILSSTGALALETLPSRVVVIGGGYIGLEIGTFLKKLGSDVTLLEATSALLNGVVDPDCSQVVSRKLKKLGIKVLLNAKAQSQKSLTVKENTELELTYEASGKQSSIKCDRILVMVGRKPNSDQMRLKDIGVELDEKGFIKTDLQRRTNIPSVFAIGDIVGQPMLAHKASHEGIMVAEIIAGHKRAYDVKTVPAVVFTDPEIASAGLMESDLHKIGNPQVLIGKFPFAANGRATSLMETDGFVKMIADKESHVLLGVHIVGPEASNLISEAALAIEMGARLEDIALTIHPHPTLGEVLMEAAEATLGHAIHIIERKK